MEKLNKKVWDLSSNYDKQLNTDIDAAWNKFDKKRKSLTDTKIVKPNFFFPITIAASLALAVGFFFINNNRSQQFQILQTANNQIENISLADGSTMWVNENSTISYFSNKEDDRNVELKGEAYFEVAPDKAKPFVVKADKTEIRVLGTAFNVREIESTKAIEVEVHSGVVFVSSGSNQIELKKGERVIVKNGNLKKQEGTNIGGWRNKELKFNQRSIAEILEEIQRVYDVKVVFRNRDLESCSFTTNFQNESIENILEVIRIGFGCELKKATKNSYVLKGGSCK